MSTPKLRRILPLFFGVLLLAAIAEAATVKEPFNKTLPASKAG
jgi:peptidoglycan/LPS O-acetylase OafA/YrhL